MRYPDFLKDNGNIGFVAPAFGCASEPYKSAFDNALKKLHAMGFGTHEGSNCRMEKGIGISNTPQRNLCMNTPIHKMIYSCRAVVENLCVRLFHILILKK